MQMGSAGRKEGWEGDEAGRPDGWAITHTSTLERKRMLVRTTNNEDNVLQPLGVLLISSR